MWSASLAVLRLLRAARIVKAERLGCLFDAVVLPQPVSEMLNAVSAEHLGHTNVTHHLMRDRTTIDLGAPARLDYVTLVSRIRRAVGDRTLIRMGPGGYVLTNADRAQRVDTNDDWSERTWREVLGDKVQATQLIVVDGKVIETVPRQALVDLVREIDPMEADDLARAGRYAEPRRAILERQHPAVATPREYPRRARWRPVRKRQ